MPAEDSPSAAGASARSPFWHLGHPDAHAPMFEAPQLPSEPLSRRSILLFLLAAIVAAFLGQQLEHLGAAAQTPRVALPWVLPFVLLLAAIATMPFLAKHFWEKHYHHVAIALGAIVAAYYLLLLPSPRAAGQMPAGFFEAHAGLSMARSFGDYISFIFLLGSLFTVSGGILIRVRRKATPPVNTALLLIGAILANVLGTTGAAMLLIRPYLRINRGHIRPYHVVFFIFLVANVGGCLTPIGDPPLFLGYLKGIPFWWVLEHCWPMWLLAVGLLLAIFFGVDSSNHRGTPRKHHDPHDLGPAISIYGGFNLILVIAILAGVLLHDPLNTWFAALHLPHMEALPFRELIMAAATALSLWTTPRRIHLENVFNFAPIREVALLFVGIFATMVPALNYLSLHAEDPALERLLRTPGQFYFSAGTLSSVLDNAPTYLTFLETELGKIDANVKLVARDIVADPSKDRPAADDFAKLKILNAQRYALAPDAQEQDAQLLNNAFGTLRRYRETGLKARTLTPAQVEVAFLLGDPRLNWYIVAISLGAVFFGALTYIGNGPNFMVKSIAENADVPCPSFFGYIFAYSLPILMPILVLIWFLFISGHGSG